MAVIGISTEPSGRTRVLFDFRVPSEDDEERIARVMAQSCPAARLDEGEAAAEPNEARRARRVVPAFR